MNRRYKTIRIAKVGQSGEPLCAKVGRGVFNFDSFLDYLSHPVDSVVEDITIDLSGVGWISLFDWNAFLCLLHGQIADKPHLKIGLDFVGDTPRDLIPYRECSDYLAGRMITPRFSDDDYNDSLSVHRVLSFVKSLEESGDFKNVARGQIVLSRVSWSEAGTPGYYRKNTDVEENIILPRINVESKEMCLKFANRSQIELWRKEMVIKHVPNAAVFQSEEFWRVLCHELARNVVEHANGPGFITGRVVLPVKGKMPVWCSDVYDEVSLHQLGSAKHQGFVELCISDAGVGIPNTIELSYMHRYKERHGKDLEFGSISHEDLLKFAFDELGTCKDTDRSWITDRHALGHMLFIIEKYGGVLSVRSNNAAQTYCPGTGQFKRCTTQLGFEPQNSRAVSSTIPGTHLQLLIPLTPQSNANISPRQTSVYPLPRSFHVDHRHPIGPLVPIRDKFGALYMCIDGDATFKFKEASRGLARELLRGSHPRSQMLVFDFSEVEWTPAQFETFLYLMQNVFLNRLVLFTQVSREFAELINAQEDEDLPTYLSDAKWDLIQKGNSDREFTEGRFLETYSALGALVLALGPEQGEFLFGVRDRSLRIALLELINNEQQTIQGLCEAHGLDEHVLSAVLHRASKLFRVDSLNRWESVFVRGTPDRDDLEVQRLRAITENFDIVAKQCNAWRGRNSSRSASASAQRVGRYYLPTENAVYTEFFETSRILARERYVLEIAERLLNRICYGLGSLPHPGLRLEDVDILACSTTPTVMLAEAIRRAWPVESKGNRPVVIDYGPSLFSGADPAHIPNAGGGNLRAIVVQDLFDEGSLTKKLVDLAANQGIEILFVLSFIRFLDMDDSKAKAFPPNAWWDDVHPMVNKAVHSMIGLRRPAKSSRMSVPDWGACAYALDYVVDPRSLRPVPLKSLRLESGFSEERSLTKRDSHLREFDMDEGECRLAAGHFVYGNRHFAVVVDIRGVLTGSIGYKITTWLADLCCDYKDRDVSWEEKRETPLCGEISAILLPMHSQIHYILPALQMELAQRDRRVPHYFLGATSFGGGVETYDIPYQLQDQIVKAAQNIKEVVDSPGTDEEKQNKIKESQLRLILIDDAIFSGITAQTVLESLAKHISFITKEVYEGKEEKYKGKGPIEWIRSFVVLNQLPAARSALWHQLTTCSASSGFCFDEYAPFIGVATFSTADCPACRKLEQLEHLAYRIRSLGLTHAADWIRDRKELLSAISTEAPILRKKTSPLLPEPIEVLALSGGGAPERYNPLHVDSAIWRFYELIYLSYPLGDLLECLQTTRKSGLNHPNCRNEYARFRLAVYDWCVHNWHQVRLYHAEEQVLNELKVEVKEGDSIFVEVIYQLNDVISNEPVLEFVKWAIDSLAESDANGKLVATESTMNLDTALTLLFFAFPRTSLEETGLLDYLNQKQANMTRKSSFIAILHLLLTRPRVAAPGWALTTIAETCFRGRIGRTVEERRTTDHELLGRIVSDTALEPGNMEKRRRLEGSLYAFIAAVENLQPYFDDDILSPIVSAARDVRDWLQKPLLEALDNTTSLVELNNRMHDDHSWKRFAKDCHMPASEFKILLEARLDELRKEPHGDMRNTVPDKIGIEPESSCKNNRYYSIELEVEVDPEVEGWCLMTHIPRLIACVSNIALEPVKNQIPNGPSRILIKPCVPSRPQSVSVDVFTRFGSVETALDIIANSGKIRRGFDDLRLFDVLVEEPTPDSDIHGDVLRFSMVVPVGFQ